jgi:hypothetical protein
MTINRQRVLVIIVVICVMVILLIIVAVQSSSCVLALKSVSAMGMSDFSSPVRERGCSAACRRLHVFKHLRQPIFGQVVDCEMETPFVFISEDLCIQSVRLVSESTFQTVVVPIIALMVEALCCPLVLVGIGDVAFQKHAELPHTVRFLKRVDALLDQARDVTRTEMIN